jgi:hypothetical protein
MASYFIGTLVAPHIYIAGMASISGTTNTLSLSPSVLPPYIQACLVDRIDQGDTSLTILWLRLLSCIHGTIGAVLPVSAYREKLLVLARAGLGGPEHTKASVLVPVLSLENGVLVEKTHVMVSTHKDGSVPATVTSQVHYQALSCVFLPSPGSSFYRLAYTVMC